MLRKAGIEHRLLRYAYRADGGAEQAAADLGVEPERMYKSMVAKAGDELRVRAPPGRLVAVAEEARGRRGGQTR